MTPSPNWISIVGRGYTTGYFDNYVRTITLNAWHPQFVVLHNTGAPMLSQWHQVTGEQRMLNLEAYYRNQQKWHAGPHIFVADDLIWAFTPLTVPGIHSPSWNHLSWGVELVGNYEIEPLGDAVRENAIAALASLHRLGAIDPQTLRLHREDPLTSHACPGKNVVAVKADIIAAVVAALVPSFAPDADHEIAT